MSEKYKELLEQYDVKVLSTFRSRGTFQCETEQGLALLKEYHGSLQKLALEYEWKEKLANAGFLTTDRYFLTKEESLVTNIANFCIPYSSLLAVILIKQLQVVPFHVLERPE